MTKWPRTVSSSLRSSNQNTKLGTNVNVAEDCKAKLSQINEILVTNIGRECCIVPKNIDMFLKQFLNTNCMYDFLLAFE